MQVFLLESKCYPVNSYTFQQMLECYLWLATAQHFIPAYGTESQLCYFWGGFRLFVCFNLLTFL